MSARLTGVLRAQEVSWRAGSRCQAPNCQSFSQWATADDVRAILNPLSLVRPESAAVERVRPVARIGLPELHRRGAGRVLTAALFALILSLPFRPTNVLHTGCAAHLALMQTPAT